MSKPDDAHIIALEWLKHLITLSSSIIVLSGSLVGIILDNPNWSLWILFSSWILFISVILLCLETISTITYSRINGNNNWTDGTGKNMALASKWLFIIAIVLFVIFAGINVSNLVSLIDKMLGL